VVAYLIDRWLEAESADRALADLEEVRARAEALYGAREAERKVAREGAGILLWWAFGGVLRIGSRLPRPGSFRGGGLAGDFARDVRFGVRGLLRQPGFAALAVLILGLGIGANSTIFSLANRMFVSAPPSVLSPGELVRVSRSWAPGQGGSMSYPDYEWHRQAASTLSGLMAYWPAGVAVTAGAGGTSAPARAWLVSDNYFEVLGLEPAAGRFFAPEENATPLTHPVAVISYGFWERVLGRSPAAPGSDVVLNGTSFRIIGVAPRPFRGLSPAEDPPDVFLPIMMLPAVQPQNDEAWYRRLPHARTNWLVVVGRLRPGAGIGAVRAELAAAHEALKREYPSEPQDVSVLVTAQYRYAPGVGRSLADLTALLLLAVAAVLAIASANVAVLLLSRATVRSREMGVRSALGAGRGRVFRQLLTEILVLALAGGTAGLLLSMWSARVAAGLLPFRLAETGPDGLVVAVTTGLAVLVAVLAGVAPALETARSDVFSLIQARGRRGARSRLRDGLVVLQVALSLVLVAGAVLFTRSLQAARTRDVGFDARSVLLLSVNLRSHGYDRERAHAFLRAATERLAGLPGAIHVTSTRMVPFQGDWTTTIQPPAGALVSAGEDGVVVGLNAVMPGYFETMGIPQLTGRGIELSDDADRERVVVVNRHLAESFWPGQDAVGQPLHLDGQEEPPYRVVGVAGDATYYRLGEEPQLQAYGAMLQMDRPVEQTFALRTAGDPLALARPAQDALHALDPDLAFYDVRSLESVFAEEIGRFRIAARLVGLFAALALALACAGLYAAISFVVTRRTREIGVRMALGATRPQVARAIVARGLLLAAIGIAIGVAGGLALTRLLGGFLFGVSPRDPLTFLVAPLVLFATAAVAAFLPARRAMAVDPLGAIRAD
jgi:predicted permease